MRTQTQILWVMGKLPFKIGAVISPGRVLFLIVVQQQTMLKLQNGPHMKSTFKLAEWESRELNTVFLVSLRSLISQDINLLPFPCALCFGPLPFLSNFNLVYGTYGLSWTFMGTLTSLFFLVYIFVNSYLSIPAVLFLWVLLRSGGFGGDHWMVDIVQRKSSVVCLKDKPQIPSINQTIETKVL